MTRLIDADALIKTLGIGDMPIRLTYEINHAPTIDAVPVSDLKDTEKERDYWRDMAHSYEQTILRLTISASDTTAEPVRHGKWVPKYIRICGQDWASGMKCSECGEDALNAEGDEFLTDYCPNCGADMRGEKDG